VKLKLADIQPSPFRDTALNPYKPDALDRLKQSISETDLWNNVLVRKNEVGEYCLLYGHHRVLAAKNLGIIESDFQVVDVDDESALKMFVYENDPAYGTNIEYVMECIQAVVKALADGKIPPFKHDAKTNKTALRYAPYYTPGRKPEGCDSNLLSHYTVLDIATFLGRTISQSRGGALQAAREVIAAFQVLAILEAGAEGWTKEEIHKRYVADHTTDHWATSRILQDVTIKQRQVESQLAKLRKETAEHKKKAEDFKQQQLEAQNKQFEATQAAQQADEEFIEAQEKKLKEDADKAKTERDQKKEEAAQHAKDAAARCKDIQSEEEIIEINRKAEARLKKEQEQRAAQQWQDRVKTFLGKLNRLFTEDDPLYAEGKSLRKDARCTDEQRALFALALRDASNRFAQFSPQATSQSAKQDAAMKELKAKAPTKKGKK
jgi:ParB-like nuclease domain